MSTDHNNDAGLHEAEDHGPEAIDPNTAKAARGPIPYEAPRVESVELTKEAAEALT